MLQSLLHFSLGALSICGGPILLILSSQIVLGEGASPEGHEQKEVMEQAVSPLGTPLMLNPIGMVARVTFSAAGQLRSCGTAPPNVRWTSSSWRAIRIWERI